MAENTLKTHRQAQTHHNTHPKTTSSNRGNTHPKTTSSNRGSTPNPNLKKLNS